MATYSLRVHRSTLNIALSDRCLGCGSWFSYKRVYIIIIIKIFTRLREWCRWCDKTTKYGSVWSRSTRQFSMNAFNRIARSYRPLSRWGRKERKNGSSVLVTCATLRIHVQAEIHEYEKLSANSIKDRSSKKAFSFEKDSPSDISLGGLIISKYSKILLSRQKVQV